MSKPEIFISVCTKYAECGTMPPGARTKPCRWCNDLLRVLPEKLPLLNYPPEQVWWMCLPCAERMTKEINDAVNGKDTSDS